MLRGVKLPGRIYLGGFGYSGSEVLLEGKEALQPSSLV